MLSRFHLIPERNGQTDGRTDRFAISISRVSILTRDKNLCKRTALVQLITKNVVTCFLEHSIVWRPEDTEAVGRQRAKPSKIKPDTVDRPVRTARIFLHHYNSTQYCNTETVIFFSIFPFLQTNITSHNVAKWTSNQARLHQLHFKIHFCSKMWRRRTHCSFNWPH